MKIPGHPPFLQPDRQNASDRRARFYLGAQYSRWRRHPLSAPLTRADWLVMLYGAVSGPVYMYLGGEPLTASLLIGAFVGFFLMLALVVLTKVLLIWEYMRIPVALVRAV